MSSSEAVQGQATGRPIAGQLTGRRPLSSPLLRPRGGAGSRMVQARGSGETMTTRATASAGNDGGTVRTGASARAAPYRAETLRRGEPTLGGRPRFRGPLVARRYAPTRNRPVRKAAVDSERTEADHNG